MTRHKSARKAAFPLTLPVLTGYLVLGAAYGILMNSKDIPLIWTIFSSIFIYAGSMQFVTVTLLAGGFDPIGAFFITLMVNARHLFYGISMLGKYRGIGRLKPYLIFSLTDETFSLVCSDEPPQGVDKKLFYFYISLLNHFYWITGSILGGILGGLFKFNSNGIDFVLTALFVVIFINQWKSTKNHLPALIGLSGALLCRLIFGSKDFMVPSLLFILITVTLLKRPLERRNME